MPHNNLEAEKPVRRHFELGETAVTIVAEERFVALAEESIFNSREVIQRFIAIDPLFKDTLEPYRPPKDAPALIQRMCAASAKAKVGPMASVAGAIAEEAVKAMVEAGARQAVVDNGGDISMFLTEPLEVGIFAGDSGIKDLGLLFPAERRLYSVCTSSGTVGPSISFGIADAAVVLATEATLADACATRLGNEVQRGEEACMVSALETVLGIKGVDGALVIVDEKLAMRGILPPLIRTRLSPRAISKLEI